jgi:hypothetical protein
MINVDFITTFSGTIGIDLDDMLDEKGLPDPVLPTDNILY